MGRFCWWQYQAYLSPREKLPSSFKFSFLDIGKTWVLNDMKCIFSFGFKVPKFHTSNWVIVLTQFWFITQIRGRPLWFPVVIRDKIYTSALLLNLYKPLNFKENWQTTLKRPLKPNACSENRNCILSDVFCKPTYLEKYYKEH